MAIFIYNILFSGFNFSIFYTYLCKFMAKAEPFLLHEDLKALDSSVVGIQHQHGQAGQLATA